MSRTFPEMTFHFSKDKWRSIKKRERVEVAGKEQARTAFMASGLEIGDVFCQSRPSPTRRAGNPIERRRGMLLAV